MELKKHKILMLPTGKGDNFPILKNLDRAGGLFAPTSNYYYTRDYLINEKWKACHLYVISDDEIKDGDWCICYSKGGSPYTIKYSKSILEDRPKSHYPDKIIATTDDTLGYGDNVGAFYYLPQLSKSFIEEYIRLNGIDEVMVEYKHYHGVNTSVAEINSISGDGTLNWQGKEDLRDIKLLIDTNNKITIHQIKNTWNEEEVEEICDLYESILSGDFHVMTEEDMIKRIKEIKQPEI